jgi:hypothetical protein
MTIRDIRHTWAGEGSCDYRGCYEVAERTFDLVHGWFFDVVDGEQFDRNFLPA